MFRPRPRLSLILWIASISFFATSIFAQTPSVRVLGNDVLTFEESGSRPGNNLPLFSSSVSGLDFGFYESRAAVDITPANGSEGTPIRLTLAGASQNPRISPEGLLPGIVNYFPSRDNSTWRTNLRTWSSLRYQGIYPGVDLVYYGNHGQLEYDFVVAPQHDPRAIAIEISNSQVIHITADGGLNISGSGASLSFSKPVIYQLAADGSRDPIAGRYVMNGAGVVGFDIAS